MVKPNSQHYRFTFFGNSIEYYRGYLSCFDINKFRYRLITTVICQISVFLVAHGYRFRLKSKNLQLWFGPLLPKRFKPPHWKCLYALIHEKERRINTSIQMFRKTNILSFKSLMSALCYKYSSLKS